MVQFHIGDLDGHFVKEEVLDNDIVEFTLEISGDGAGNVIRTDKKGETWTSMYFTIDIYKEFQYEFGWPLNRKSSSRNLKTLVFIFVAFPEQERSETSKLCLFILQQDVLKLKEMTINESFKIRI